MNNQNTYPFNQKQQQQQQQQKTKPSNQSWESEAKRRKDANLDTLYYTASVIVVFVGLSYVRTPLQSSHSHITSKQHTP
jgi:cytochrome c oxidase assembly protein Cox11